MAEYTFWLPVCLFCSVFLTPALSVSSCQIGTPSSLHVFEGDTVGKDICWTHQCSRFAQIKLWHNLQGADLYSIRVSTIEGTTLGRASNIDSLFTQPNIFEVNGAFAIHHTPQGALQTQEIYYLGMEIECIEEAPIDTSCQVLEDVEGSVVFSQSSTNFGVKRCWTFGSSCGEMHFAGQTEFIKKPLGEGYLHLGVRGEGVAASPGAFRYEHRGEVGDVTIVLQHPELFYTVFGQAFAFAYNCSGEATLPSLTPPEIPFSSFENCAG